MAPRKRKISKKRKAVAKRKPAKARTSTSRAKASSARVQKEKVQKGTAQKEYEALRAQARRIAKDFDSPDAALVKQAAAEWNKLGIELEAWAERNGVKLISHAIQSQAPAPTLFSYGSGSSACTPTYNGTLANGNTIECTFRRYRRRTAECLYRCVEFYPSGLIVI